MDVIPWYLKMVQEPPTPHEVLVNDLTMNWPHTCWPHSGNFISHNALTLNLSMTVCSPCIADIMYDIIITMGGERSDCPDTGFLPAPGDLTHCQNVGMESVLNPMIPVMFSNIRVVLRASLTLLRDMNWSNCIGIMHFCQLTMAGQLEGSWCLTILSA